MVQPVSLSLHPIDFPSERTDDAAFQEIMLHVFSTIRRIRLVASCGLAAHFLSEYSA
jgi:hypothetical protein